VPQGLKPRLLWPFFGTTKVVPFQNIEIFCKLFLKPAPEQRP
jgi:hypothetical protein